MKLLKVFAVLFVATLSLGGMNLVSAYTTAKPFNNLKADFLGDPHYTPLYTKTTWSSQKVIVTSTSGDRNVQLCEFNQDNEAVSGYVWIVFKTGVTKDWDSSSYQIPTSYAGDT
ncbi:MAG: hypothetical protein WC917_02365 [Bacilli bacterium]